MWVNQNIVQSLVMVFSSQTNPIAVFSFYQKSIKSQTDYRLHDDTNKVPRQQLSERESPFTEKAEALLTEWRDSPSIHPSVRPSVLLPPPPSKLLMMTNLCSVLSQPPTHPSLLCCLPVPVLPPRLSSLFNCLFFTTSHLPADCLVTSHSLISSNTHDQLIKGKLYCNFVPNKQTYQWNQLLQEVFRFDKSCTCFSM